MAARLNCAQQDGTPWRFYVYDLIYGDRVLYVGKGSGNRLAVQHKRYRLNGHEVARFKREKDAYAYEVTRISELSPVLNKHKGGNGSRATPRKNFIYKYSWEREIERIGSRVYVARMLIDRFLSFVDPSKVDAIRRVAYG